MSNMQNTNSASVLSVVDKLPQSVSNQQTIEALEGYLEDARAGRYTEIAIVAIGKDSLSTFSSDTANRLNIIGALFRLMCRLERQMDGSMTEDGGAA